MEELRRIDERLRRIDALRAAGARSDVLLDELRTLLREGEAWIAAEGPGTEAAALALESLGAALRSGEIAPTDRADPGEVMPGSAAV